MPTFRTSRPVSAADPAKPHIILVGLPGAGKSSVGAALADSLGRTFLDFDLEISRRQGMSIQEIFGQRGEQHFRDLEHRLTEELRELGNMVLAPGGGWMGRSETVALLRPPARIVYLKVTAATAVRRMGTGVGTRPLLRHPNAVGDVDRLLALRREAYETADVAIDEERQNAQQVTEKLLEQLRTEQSGSEPASGGGG